MTIFLKKQSIFYISYKDTQCYPVLFERIPLPSMHPLNRILIQWSNYKGEHWTAVFGSEDDLDHSRQSVATAVGWGLHVAVIYSDWDKS